jgi:hypothetical protein
MEKPSDKIITYKDESNGIELTYRLPWDCCLGDCFDAFKLILKGMTFSTETIETYMEEYESDHLDYLRSKGFKDEDY